LKRLEKQIAALVKKKETYIFSNNLKMANAVD
jgi:hypothetical protein